MKKFKISSLGKIGVYKTSPLIATSLAVLLNTNFVFADDRFLKSSFSPFVTSLSAETLTATIGGNSIVGSNQDQVHFKNPIATDKNQLYFGTGDTQAITNLTFDFSNTESSQSATYSSGTATATYTFNGENGVNITSSSAITLGASGEGTLTLTLAKTQTIKPDTQDKFTLNITGMDSKKNSFYGNIVRQGGGWWGYESTITFAGGMVGNITDSYGEGIVYTFKTSGLKGSFTNAKGGKTLVFEGSDAIIDNTKSSQSFAVFTSSGENNLNNYKYPTTIIDASSAQSITIIGGVSSTWLGTTKIISDTITIKGTANKNALYSQLAGVNILKGNNITIGDASQPQPVILVDDYSGGSHPTKYGTNKILLTRGGGVILNSRLVEI